MKQDKLNIASVNSAFSSEARKHGIGAAVSVSNGKPYIVIGSTWYPEDKPAFLKGTAPLTIDSAKEFAKILAEKIENFDTLSQEATKVAAEATTEADDSPKRGRGRPKGSTNKPKTAEPNKTEEKVAEKTEISPDDQAILDELGL